MKQNTWYRATPHLRREIMNQGRRQDWFVQQLGRSKSGVHYIIHGQRSVGEEDAKQIATLLDTEFHLLFDHRDSHKKRPAHRR